jgi:hypothetical protein
MVQGSDGRQNPASRQRHTTEEWVEGNQDEAGTHLGCRCEVGLTGGERSGDNDAWARRAEREGEAVKGRKRNLLLPAVVQRIRRCNTHFLQIIKFYQISSVLGCISK